MKTLFHSLVLQPTALGACRLGLALTAVCMVACTSTPKSEVVVSVKDQKLGIYDKGQLVKQYTISTSKFGLGDRPGSCRTPLGKHEIIAKIGHGLPPGAVLKSRSWNGEVLKPNAPGRDPIVSRILWLRGMESSNRNAMNRYIYIHGTPEESRLGTPASYGCIRMGMKDVVEAFNEIGIGAKVVVTKGALPQGHKPTPEAVVDVPPQAKPADPSAPPVPNAIPVAPAANTAAASVNSVSKVGPEAPAASAQPASKPKVESKPVAKSKSKKTAAKPEKITTSNRRQASTAKAHS